MKEITEKTAKELARTIEEVQKVAEESAETFQRTYGVLAQEIKLECAKKIINYADKYSNATFLTRWYWKRKLRKFVKGIDVLKEL